MTLRAVLFDLDDTLFAHRSAVDAAILAHLAASGVAAADPAAVLVRWRALEEHHYHRYLHGELDYLGQRRARAGDFLAEHGGRILTDEAADAWWTAYLQEYRNAWRLHEDALPCLDALAAAVPGIRFGIITNGELDFQTTKLDAMRLSERMDVVVASADVGVTKPDPRIFEIACERLGVTPGEAAYVGDRLRTDAIGAADAGLLGVWLDRGHEAPDPQLLTEAEALGVVRISGLDELPPLLKNTRC
ncbi:HAD family hydrolase [Naasia sp. SYSU D00948]|uniref:HAD family hydrolase n=1 Tax=Naasia sp. SYSU D00948 TaxID=2817379 RepID=UPI001B30C815|nr:HAD family hydrolase [Naasia sp. SYSU D00948]